MNDQEPNGDQSRDRAAAVALLLHAACCGLPLLLLLVTGAGVTAGALRQVAPYAALAVLALGVVGAVWYLRRGRRTPCSEACEIARPGRPEHAAEPWRSGDGMGQSRPEHRIRSHHGSSRNMVGPISIHREGRGA